MRHAFSLVELSIVLVILGLLTGGILAGQSLIRASELRNVNASIQNYSTAIFSFRDKYFALPGDLNNAKAFWAGCTDHTNNNCNGNGDGMVDYEGNACTYVNGRESGRSWQHLAFAGMVEGNYNGMNANCSGPLGNGTPGFNAPALKIPTVGIMYQYSGAAANLMNILNIGGYYGNALEAGFVTASEAWNIDTKIDDGLANRGRLRGGNGHTTLGHTTCTLSNAYDLTSDNKHCRFMYRMQ